MKKLSLLFVVCSSLSAIAKPCQYGNQYYVYKGIKYQSYDAVKKAGYKEPSMRSNAVETSLQGDYECKTSNGLTWCSCQVATSSPRSSTSRMITPSGGSNKPTATVSLGQDIENSYNEVQTPEEGQKCPQGTIFCLGIDKCLSQEACQELLFAQDPA